jgi:tricorn protease
MFKMCTTLLAIFGLSMSISAQITPLWMKNPAISPDGKTIVFSYKGDLYKVETVGGVAIPLTLNEAHDATPVWSPDGTKIAFASDRYGNFDVFIMPATGGEAKRLTQYSGNDYPTDFSPDGKEVIFSSPRNGMKESVRFPSKRFFSMLYSVPVSGGRSILISSAAIQNAHYDNTGQKIIFQDRKGYEDEWRKRHTSSVTRDIWEYDLKKQSYTKITDFEGEDREPIFSANAQSIYYLSEKKGDQNLFKRNLANGNEVQLTTFEKHPVRELSRSKEDLLCFTWNGEIYTVKEGQKPFKLAIRINADIRGNEEQIIPVNGGATEIALSPNGKEIAFVFRGEVFVTATDKSLTKRITNTPAQERSLSWGLDGKALFYASERGDSWDIYKATLVRKEEPYFFNATLVSEKLVINGKKDDFQPVVSPDGKEIAYLEDRNVLKVYNLEKKATRTIISYGENFSYRDGDQHFAWSPDSKWIVAENALGYFGKSNLVLYDANSDKKGINLTNSGFYNGYPQWALKGKALIWLTDKNGKRSLANSGEGDVDIYAMFFDPEEFDRFKLDKDEYALLIEKEKKDKEEKEKNEKDEKEKKSTDKKEVIKPLLLELTNIDNRKVKLTPGSVDLSSFQMTADGGKVYFMAKYEDKYNVWELDARTKELKLLAKTNSKEGDLVLSADGKMLVVLADGNISKIEIEGAKLTPVVIKEEMLLNKSAERTYIFNHAWRQVKNKFYDPKIHGIDWEMYRDNYARFLPHINNNYDFQILLSELLGELNASHTGGRYKPQSENGDQTASLGLFYDEKSKEDGLLVQEVIQEGPLANAKSKIQKGHIIKKIDGTEITANTEWNGLLNRKAGKNLLLSLYDPIKKVSWEETVKPISQDIETALLYKRWTTTMRKMVDSLSNGKVGYVHVQGMNDPSYRKVFDEVLGRNIDKDALIVDTRFNGGGWLHEDLSNFLNGKQYATFHPYGFESKGGEPADKWFKPSAVLMSEGNYSDAHGFPFAYRAKGIGKLIGMPVPGTMTAVWWETQIDPTMVFGIPMIAFHAMGEKEALENKQLNPDIKVDVPYEEILNGTDAQIKAAVKELLKK